MDTTAKKMPRTPEGDRGETHTAAGVSAGLSAAVCIGVQRQYARRDSGNFDRYLDDDTGYFVVKTDQRLAVCPFDILITSFEHVGHP